MNAPVLTRPSLPGLTRRDALRFFGLAAATALAPAFVRGASGQAPEDKKSLTGPQPGFYRFSIGAFEAIAFVDGGMSGPTAEMQLWHGHAPEQIGAELKNSFLAPDVLRLPFSVLLVRIGSELVLIDAGAGPLFGPIGGKFAGHLADAGITPEQITAVILTHAHGDHMGGLLDADHQPVFKNARHFIHRREYDFWTGSSPDLSHLGMPPKDRADMISGAKTYLGALTFEKIKGGDRLLDGIEIIDAPGHTPGHIALLISSGNDQLLHLVDSAHHHVLSFAHPDWDFAFDADPKLAIETRKRILDRASADRLRIFGAHLPFPALGHVRILGKNRYEHVMEPWISS